MAELNENLNAPSRDRVSYDFSTGLRNYFGAIGSVFDAHVENKSEYAHAAVKSANLGCAIMSYAEMENDFFHYVRNSKKIGQTGLDLVLVQLITKGEELRVADNIETNASEGDICFIDLTRDFTSRVTNAANLTFAIPRTLLALDDAEIDGLHGMVLGRNMPSTKILASHLKTLWQEAQFLSLGEAHAMSKGTIDLLGALIAPNIEDNCKSGAIANAQIIRIRKFIEANLHNPALDPDTLCKYFAISRAGLYRIFAPLGGVADFIRLRRLKRAFELISNSWQSQKSISAIAFECGFSDINTFARAFKNRFSMTPSDVRDLARQNSENLDFVYTNYNKDDSLNAWLRHMSFIV